MQPSTMILFCQDVHQTCVGMLEHYDACTDKEMQVDNLGMMAIFAGSVYRMCDVYESAYDTQIEAAAVLAMITAAFGIYALSEYARMKQKGDHIRELHDSIIAFIDEYDVPVEAAIQHVLGKRVLNDNVVQFPVRAAPCTQKP